jgi:transposase
LIYLDESSINQSVSRDYGYALRGKKIVGKVKGKRTKKLNIIAGLYRKEMIAPFTYEGNMDTLLFNDYLAKILLPTLEKGNIIIMDNASYHKSKETRELIEEKGCQLIYLPPYSPDLNKIENYWAIIKKKVKKYYPLFKSLQQTIDYIFNPLFSFSSS